MFQVKLALTASPRGHTMGAAPVLRLASSARPPSSSWKARGQPRRLTSSPTLLKRVDQVLSSQLHMQQSNPTAITCNSSRLKRTTVSRALNHGRPCSKHFTCTDSLRGRYCPQAESRTPYGSGACLTQANRAVVNPGREAEAPAGAQRRELYPSPWQ